MLPSKMYIGPTLAGPPCTLLKPCLERRVGTIRRVAEYMEFHIHIHITDFTWISLDAYHV